MLPGEFEPAERLIVAWDDYLADFLLDVMAAAWDQVHITVLLAPGQPDDLLTEGLTDAGLDPWLIEEVRVPIGSVWVRDFGPLVVRNQRGARHIVDFAYYLDDIEDDLPSALGRRLWPNWPVKRSSLDIEGGNLLSDGRGQCITTAGYVDDDMAPIDTIDDVSLRRELRAKLGCRRLVILPPLLGEPTGHVDMFATITSPGEVLLGRFDPDLDPDNAARLDRAERILREAGFRVRRIPMAYHGDGVFRSYTNSLAINKVVIVPVYPESPEGEAEALAAFQAAYPGRRIVPVIASDIIPLYGAVHCATMTVAAPPDKPVRQHAPAQRRARRRGK